MGGLGVLLNYRVLAFTFLFSFLLVSSIQALASCMPDSNQSLGDVRRLYGDYSYSCSNPLTLNFGNFSCVVAVDRICISSMINNTDYINSILRDDAEKQAFQPAILKLQNSSSYILQTQLARENVFREISEGIRGVCNQTWQLFIPEAITAPFSPLLSIIVPAHIGGCTINEFVYLSDAQLTLDYTGRALEADAQGMNLAMDTLQKEADELYCMGAGDSNYTGSERSTYNKIKDIIIDSKLDVDPAGNYTTLSKKWAVLLKNSEDMNNYFYTTNQTCTAAAMINSSLGEAGTFSQILDLYREVRLAEQSLNESYRNKSVQISLRINKISSDLEEARGQNYNSISADDINFFLTSWNQGLEEFPDPARLIQVSSDAVSGIGDSADFLYREGNSIYTNTRKFRVTNALEKFSEAEVKLNYALSNLASLENSVQLLLNDAENKTLQMRAVSRKAIDNFRMMSGKEDIYNMAEAKWNSADTRYNDLKIKKKGLQVHEYYLAYVEFKSARDIINKTDVQESYKQAKATCDDLGQIIILSEKDDVDVNSAKSTHDAMVSLINKSLESGNSTQLYLAAQSCSSKSNELYSLASMKYQYLLDKRQKVIESISLLKALGKMDYQKENNFSKYENYIYVGNFSKSALGNYKSMEILYDSILSDFISRKAAAFAKYFADHTYIKDAIISSIVYADQKTEVIIPIEIRNSLSLGCNETFSYTVSGVSLGPEDTVEVSNSAIDVTASGSGLNIFFKNASADTSYSIIIRKKELIVSSSPQSWTRIFLDVTELRERKVFQLTSSRDAGQVAFNTTYSRDADTCEAYINGETYAARIDGRTISTIFSNIRKGTAAGYIDCHIANPITITRSNYTIDNSSITYYTYVRSNAGSIEDARITFTVSSPVEGESVRVYDSTGRLAQESSYAKYGDEYLIKWIIPSLSSNLQTYRIVFQVSSTYDYVMQKRAEVTAKANANNVNISSNLERIDGYIKTLQYKEALDALIAAEGIVDDYIALKSKKDTLTQQADLLSEKMNALSNASALTQAGIADVAVELDKKKNEFESKLQQFQSYLINNNVEDAAKLLRDMETISDVKSVDNLLYKKETDVFEDLNNLKTKLLLIGRIKDMSSYVNELNIEQAKLSSLGQAISSNDYSTYSSILSEITETISRISSIEQAERENITEITSAKMNDIKELNSTWKNIKSKILKTVEVDASNPGKILDSSSIESLKNGISDMDQRMIKLNEAYSSLKSMNTSEIITRIDEINTLSSDIAAANKTLQYLDALNTQYRNDAGNSFTLGRTTLEGILPDISDDEKEKADQLSSYLSRAKKSYEAGQYLDSMLYSDYVRQNANNLKKKTTVYIDPIIILISLILVASIILAFMLLRKEKPKEAQILEKMQE